MNIAVIGNNNNICTLIKEEIYTPDDIMQISEGYINACKYLACRNDLSLTEALDMVLEEWFISEAYHDREKLRERFKLCSYTNFTLWGPNNLYAEVVEIKDVYLTLLDKYRKAYETPQDAFNEILKQGLYDLDICVFSQEELDNDLQIIRATKKAKQQTE